MSKYLLLTKVMLKSFDLGLGGGGIKKKKNYKSVILAVILIICLLPLGFSIGMGVFSLYDALAGIQQEGLILGLGLTVVSMAIFFFGIFYIISVFYFSKDIENLLPLPLRPSEILGAKFTVTLIYEYFTELLFLAPILIAFGIKAHGSILYYLFAILTFLILPIVPMVYAALLSMLLMRVTNIGRNKDRFKIVGGIIAMFLAVGVNIFIQRFAGSSMNPQELQQLLMQGNNSLLSIASQFFPQNSYAAFALLYNNSMRGFTNLLLFAAIVALFLIVFLFIGEKLYFKGVVGVSEASSKRKKVSEESFNKTVIQKSVLFSWTMRELKLLFRTPVYFMNCILMNFLWPVFLLLPFIAQPNLRSQIGDLTRYVTDVNYSGIVLAAAAGASIFLASSNLIAPTAISREGRSIYVNKYLPVKYSVQIMAKVLSSVAMSIIGCAMMVIAVMLFVSLPLNLLIMILIICLLGIFFSALSGILIDLYFPRLLWDNEQKAVKQNVNGVIHIFLCAAIAAGIVFGVVKLQLGLLPVFISLALIFAIVDAVLYMLLASVGSKLLGKIEV